MENARKKIDGEWRAMTGLLGSEPLPDHILAATVLSIRDQNYSVNSAGKIDRGRSIFELGQTPPRITIEGEEGPNKGKTFCAIFEFIAADEIRIAYDLSGTAYPDTFEPCEAKSNYVATFKRC
ncbi:MAG: hypothetical protein ACE361_24955 [Aureliella sp.]